MADNRVYIVFGSSIPRYENDMQFVYNLFGCGTQRQCSHSLIRFLYCGLHSHAYISNQVYSIA